MQGFVVCDTICHNLTSELTSYLFVYSDVWNQIDQYMQTYCAMKNYNLNTREKFEPVPSIEPG